MKNFNDNIGNRTRDLPTCSVVPKPTALPRASVYQSTIGKHAYRVKKLQPNEYNI